MFSLTKILFYISKFGLILPKLLMIDNHILNHLFSNFYKKTVRLDLLLILKIY